MNLIRMLKRKFDCISDFEENDILQYLTKGFIAVRHAVDHEVVRDCRHELWKKLFQSTRDEFGKMFIEDDFSKKNCYPWNSLYSNNFISRLSNLLGDVEGSFGSGWFLVNFGDHCEMHDDNNDEWEMGGHWHIDGHWFHKYAYSKDLGCVCVVYYNDVVKGGGGTVIAVGSHLVAAKELIKAGHQGLSSTALTIKTLNVLLGTQSDEDCRYISREQSVFPTEELCGNAGDIFILHPLLLHARSKNKTGNVRFMSHPGVPLKSELLFSISNWKTWCVLEKSFLWAACNNLFSIEDFMEKSMDHFSSCSYSDCDCLIHRLLALSFDSEYDGYEFERAPLKQISVREQIEELFKSLV